MIELNLKKTAELLAASYTETPISFKGISLDSRQTERGNLFVAIRGNQWDGHGFVERAKAEGAVAALVERKLPIDFPQIVVPDTKLALGVLAKYWRDQFVIPIIGVTGSLGKTTTKEMCGAILNQAGPTLISQGNQNNYYGVPLTLFKLSSVHRYAVIEMGTDRPGELAYLLNLVCPTVGIITTIAEVHLVVKEGVGFQNLEGVFEEKTGLFHALFPKGCAIVNRDDDYFGRWKALLKDKKYLTFGFHPEAEIRAKALVSDVEQRYQFDLVTPKGEIHIALSSLGRHNIINALAATAVAIRLNVSLEKIKVGLENIPLLAGRMQLYTGINGSLILDDSYNANSRTVIAVMETLAECPAKKRIMVLGDMLQLGAVSSKEHHRVGEAAKKLKLDHLLTYGKESQISAHAFGENAQHFMCQQSLIQTLLRLLDKNTVVAVKGSRGMQMEKVVSCLILDRGA